MLEMRNFVKTVIPPSPMKGYVFNHPEGFDLEEDLLFWLDHCLALNQKAKSSKKRK